MKSNVKTLPPQSSDSILLIGNNPIEMNKMMETISLIPGRKIAAEIAFDARSIVDRLLRFRPSFILIDDNIGDEALNNTVRALSRGRRTKDIPITVLKNSNYHQSINSSDILDYLLKQNLTPESLYNSIRNSLKFRMTRAYLAMSYHKRKKQLLKLVR